MDILSLLELDYRDASFILCLVVIGISFPKKSDDQDNYIT